MNNSKFPFSSRAELERFETYQPGLSIDQIKRQYGLKNVIKMASNENPWGPSKKGMVAYEKAAERIFRYPETRSVDLRQLVAQKHRLDISEVIIGAGSDEIIELLAKAFLTHDDDIVVSASAFMQYRAAGHLMGARVTIVPMTDLKHDLKAMAGAVTNRTKFVFIANPNNPTGTYNTKGEVEEFLATLPLHVIPVFDEAYFEYASLHTDYPSMSHEYFRRRPMVILRTFSKVYGMAGLRVGYGLAPEALIVALDKIRPPFNVSVPAQFAAAAAIYDDDHVAKSVQANDAGKKFLTEELTKMNFHVVPSAANFILFATKPWTGRFLFEHLLEKGIIARCVDEYALPGYLRVTVGKPDENKIFLKALREVLENS
jgi:histidinol-phosphate aminotransferase